MLSNSTCTPTSGYELEDDDEFEEGDTFWNDNSEYAATPYEKLPKVPGFDENWTLLKSVILIGDGEFPLMSEREDRLEDES